MCVILKHVQYRIGNAGWSYSPPASPSFCVFWTLECLSFSGFPAALILDEITKFFNLWKGNRHLDLEYTYARLGK